MKKVLVKNWLNRDEMSHDYNLKETDDKIKLFYSDHEDWKDSVRGKKAASLKNTGSEIVIKLDGLKIRLDYAQALEVLILLQKDNITKFKIK